MTRLLIDVGNTRIKWRAVDPDAGWRDDDAHGAVDLDERAALAAQWAGLGIRSAVTACVAGEAIHAELVAMLRRLSAPQSPISVTRLLSSAECRGLHSAYPEPTRLGADRWAAALGARARHPGRVLLVASFGTATTIDVIVPLADAGDAGASRFEGGVILPGIELMRRALARDTARLPLAQGHYRPIADNTDDAITSGILHAQAGAVERMLRAARERSGAEPLVLLGGGACALVAPLLGAPAVTATVIVEHHLVLRGLLDIDPEPHTGDLPRPASQRAPQTSPTTSAPR